MMRLLGFRLQQDPYRRDGFQVDEVVCGGWEFFIRKDFPQRVALALMILVGLASSVNLYYKEVLSAFATLAGLVVIDAIIYYPFVGRVTACYRCRAEYREGAAIRNSHQFSPRVSTLTEP